MPLYEPLFGLGLSHGAVATYGALDTIGGDTGKVYCSLAKVSRKAGLSERQARRAVHALREQNLIWFDSNDRKGTTLMIEFREHPAFEVRHESAEPLPPDKMAGHSGQGAPPPRTLWPDTPDAVSYDNLLDNQIDNPRKQPRRRARPRKSVELISFGRYGHVRGDQQEYDELVRDWPLHAELYVGKVDRHCETKRGGKPYRKPFAEIRGWLEQDQATGRLPKVANDGKQIDPNDLGLLEWQRQQEGGADCKGDPDLFRDVLDIRPDVDSEPDHCVVSRLG